MSDNKLSPPGLKIFIQKQHPVLHSSSLKPCFKPALLIDSVSSRCRRHRRWSLKAPLLLLFLFSIPTVFSRLHCFPFSNSSHCVFHCKTLLLLNPLLQFFFPAPFFFSELFLPSFMSDFYTPTDEEDLAQGHPGDTMNTATSSPVWLLTSLLCHYTI